MISEMAQMEICMLYDDGYTISELAKKFHTSRATIKRVLEDNGVVTDGP